MRAQSIFSSLQVGFSLVTILHTAKSSPFMIPTPSAYTRVKKPAREREEEQEDRRRRIKKKKKKQNKTTTTKLQSHRPVIAAVCRLFFNVGVDLYLVASTLCYLGRFPQFEFFRSLLRRVSSFSSGSESGPFWSFLSANS